MIRGVTFAIVSVLALCVVVASALLPGGLALGRGGGSAFDPTTSNVALQPRAEGRADQDRLALRTGDDDQDHTGDGPDRPLAVLAPLPIVLTGSAAVNGSSLAILTSGDLPRLPATSGLARAPPPG